MKLYVLVLFCSIAFLGPVFSDEEASSASEPEEKKEEVSLTEERKRTLQFGIDSEILPVLEIITRDEEDEYVQEVLDLLSSSYNQEVRVNIFKYLQKIENSGGIEKAEEIFLDFEDQPVGLVTAAISYLAAVKDTMTMEEILPVLEGEDSVAIPAVRTFSTVEIDGFTEKLMEKFEDYETSDEMKSEILLAFGRLKDKSALELLEALAADEGENPTRRNYACSSIGEIGEPASLPVLLQVYASKDAITRSYALYGISRINDKQSVDILISALRDSYWKIRVFACDGLGEKKVKDAVPALQYKAEKDPEIPVRTAAVKALVLIGTGEAMETVHALFESEKTSSTIRITALESMVEHNLNGSMPKIKEVFDKELIKKTPVLLNTICRILSMQKDGNLGEFYKKMLNYREMTVQIHGLRGIKNNSLGQFRAEVEKLTEEGMPSSLRKHALSTLEAL